MTASLTLFSTLIWVALVVTMLAPLILLFLLVADFNKGELW